MFFEWHNQRINRWITEYKALGSSSSNHHCREELMHKILAQGKNAVLPCVWELTFSPNESWSPLSCIIRQLGKPAVLELCRRATDVREEANRLKNRPRWSAEVDAEDQPKYFFYLRHILEIPESFELLVSSIGRKPSVDCCDDTTAAHALGLAGIYGRARLLAGWLEYSEVQKYEGWQEPWRNRGCEMKKALATAIKESFRFFKPEQVRRKELYFAELLFDALGQYEFDRLMREWGALGEEMREKVRNWPPKRVAKIEAERKKEEEGT